MHDRVFKTKQILRFLEEGDKVKVTVRFRGREFAHPELGRKLLDLVSEDLKTNANIEKAPLFEGRAMTMIVAPVKTMQRPPTLPVEAAQAARPASPSAEQPPQTVISQPARVPEPVA